MTTNQTLEKRILEKVKKLSVEQFIDSLSQEETEQQLTRISAKLSDYRSIL